MKHFKLDQYHLYGQSWGGLLAFSSLQAETKSRVLSLMLSNSPTSVRLVEQAAAALIEQCGGPEGFMQQHNCRLPVQPIELIDA